LRTLKNELALDKVAHAYIFAGPRGTGKTTVARLLAKAVNCRNKKSARERRQGKIEPCNRCVSCQEIMAGSSLDLIEIDAASNRGIDEIRSLRENVRFAPQKSAHKVLIIDEVHMLTKEAFNALLKTLEEPPPHTLFILATTEVHKVLPTILSRCQRFDFRKLTVDQITHRLKRLLKLEKRKVDGEILRLIAAKADGAIRDAESLLGQILAWPRKEIKAENVADFLGAVDWNLIFGFVNLLAKKESARAIKLVTKLTTQGHDLRNFSEHAIDYLRRIMLARVNLDLVDYGGVNFSENQKEELSSLTPKFSLKELAYLIKLFVSAKNDLTSSAIAQLPLELCIIDYCGIPQEKKEEAKKGRVTVKEAISEITCKIVPADLGKVKEKWGDVIGAVQPLNHSLCAFLKLCRPVAVKNGALILGFPRDFHKNIVSQDANKTIIEGVLDNVLGGKWRVQCEKVQGEEQKQENHLTREALEVFGGEVVK